MYGYLSPQREMGGRKAILEYRAMCGLSICQATVPVPARLNERRLERRIYCAAEKLWEAGVGYVLAPPNFPWWPVLYEAGLSPVETEGLCQAAAAPLALGALKSFGMEPEQSVVVLAGARANGVMFRTAEKLVKRVRRISVAARAGGDALANHLHREYGLPVLPPGAIRPTLTVAFDFSWHGTGPTLRLCGLEPELLGLELYIPGLEVPEECAQLPFLAAMWESGALTLRGLQARQTKRKIENDLTSQEKVPIIP